VHGDGEGWEAHDLLAHLASTQASLSAVVTAEPRAADGGGGGGRAFDPDRWNASQVYRRRDRSPAELRSELEKGSAALHAALMGVDLDRQVAIGPFAGRPVGEVMELMAAHQRAHLEVLQRSLPATPPD